MLVIVFKHVLYASTLTQLLAFAQIVEQIALYLQMQQYVRHVGMLHFQQQLAIVLIHVLILFSEIRLQWLVQHVELIVKHVKMLKFVQNAIVQKYCFQTLPARRVVVMNFSRMQIVFAQNVIQVVTNALHKVHVKNVMKIAIQKELLVELPALMVNMLLAKIEHAKHAET